MIVLPKNFEGESDAFSVVMPEHVLNDRGDVLHPSFRLADAGYYVAVIVPTFRRVAVDRLHRTVLPEHEHPLQKRENKSLLSNRARRVV